MCWFLVMSKAGLRKNRFGKVQFRTSAGRLTDYRNDQRYLLQRRNSLFRRPRGSLKPNAVNQIV